MEVFRITTPKWADKVSASGQAGRWNSPGKQMLYTAASRSLACLENAVHRGPIELNVPFRVMVLYLPDDLPYLSLSVRQLAGGWHEANEMAYNICRKFGDAWLQKMETPLLRVPSSIVKSEYNYLININHPMVVEELRIINNESFYFDPRIKSNKNYE